MKCWTKKMAGSLFLASLLLSSCKKDAITDTISQPSQGSIGGLQLLKSGTNWLTVYQYGYQTRNSSNPVGLEINAFTASSAKELMLSFRFKSTSYIENMSSIFLHESGKVRQEENLDYRKMYYYQQSNGQTWHIDRGYENKMNEPIWIRKGGSLYDTTPTPSYAGKHFYMAEQGILTVDMPNQSYRISVFDYNSEKWKCHYELDGSFNRYLIPFFHNDNVHALQIDNNSQELKLYRGNNLLKGTPDVYGSDLLHTQAFPSGPGHFKDGLWCQKGNKVYFIWEQGSYCNGCINTATIFSFDLSSNTLMAEAQIPEYLCPVSNSPYDYSNSDLSAVFDTDGNGTFYVMNSSQATGQHKVEQYTSGNSSPVVLLSDEDYVDEGKGDGHPTRLKWIKHFNGKLHAVLEKSQGNLYDWNQFYLQIIALK